jgi:hypothetical protein
MQYVPYLLALYSLERERVRERGVVALQRVESCNLRCGVCKKIGRKVHIMYHTIPFRKIKHWIDISQLLFMRSRNLIVGRPMSIGVFIRLSTANSTNQRRRRPHTVFASTHRIRIIRGPRLLVTGNIDTQEHLRIDIHIIPSNNNVCSRRNRH